MSFEKLEFEILRNIKINDPEIPILMNRVTETIQKIAKEQIEKCALTVEKIRQEWRYRAKQSERDGRTDDAVLEFRLSNVLKSAVDAIRKLP